MIIPLYFSIFIHWRATEKQALISFQSLRILLRQPQFDGLTKEQLKRLKIKTDIQRSDSFMAMSNIRSYGWVQLLIESL